jgi:iron(III) transport system substrate-binding protein
VILQMLLALVFALWPVLARAQAAATDNASIYSYNGPDREQRLIAKVREEGTLALYTSMATTESARLAQAFERRYGIKVQLWRALSENVLQRALAEARGRRRAMDVVETNAPEVEALAREQVIAPFESPYVADLPAWAVPPHRRWFSDRANLWVTWLQHRKGQARGVAGHSCRLRRSGVEGPAFARGDRL